MQRSHTARAATAALALMLAAAVHAAGSDDNTTGLPTYPHDEHRNMDAVVRSLPNGQHCSHYSSSSKDEHHALAPDAVDVGRLQHGVAGQR